ncbi:uncharacterized protein LOC111474468 isoform X1 [Cucurbita maxima]|uniref:Uncharacterized protein LOC111473617 isoform X1 n=1 Tax=Cucurbita maxima TaxID=3661 RepID=A0A6J1IIU1_CUCMA|nr:uncharacterized protein LOC111473617 isoform X1 [Cucurbita maxima]XP_022975308.1 uncharacterized protein LOC111474468 isoform X1 [Cucurbita maxima]
MVHTGSKSLTATATEWGKEKGESREREMVENGGSDGGSNAHWWWALAGATQLGWGIASFRRGVIGDSSLMPFKAFAVASLFVGAASSSAIASLKAAGIHKVEDVMEVGANIRNGLGIRPRTRDE